MAASLEHVLSQIHRWTSPYLEDHSDAALLERFVQYRDERAFAALVSRHGGMVLRSCRRVLGDAHAAEDAFQAVFLILARKAHSLRRPAELPGWLHGVARRVALKARTKSAGRVAEVSLSEEAPDTSNDPLTRLTARELLTVLDEEIARLPRAQQSAVVLCCLEGHTQEQAARMLGWTAGSVKGHLERGRRRLQYRLQRRGILLSAALALVAVARGEATSELLLPNTIKAALCGGIDSSSAALAHSVLKSMLLGKLAGVMTVVLTVALAASTTVALVYRGPAAESLEDTPPPVSTAPKAAESSMPKERKDALGDPLPRGAVARLGTIRLRHSGWINSVAYSSDGKWLASGGSDERVRVWDAETGKEVRQFSLSRKGQGASPVDGVAFSPDGKLLAAGGWGTALALWDVASGKKMRHTLGVTRYVVFSPDSRIVVTGGLPNQGAVLLDLKSNKRHNLPLGFETIHAVAFSPDGKLLAASGPKNRIYLWETATLKELRSLPGRQYEVRSLDFSPDSKQLVSCGMDKIVRLWDVASGKEIRSFQAPGIVDGVRYSPDGKTIAARSDGRSILVWGVKSRKLLHRFAGYGGGFAYPMAFSPDGKKLLAAQVTGLQVWETATGKELFPASGIRESIGKLAYSADGRTMATENGEGTIRIWDTATYRELRRFGGKQVGMGSLAYSDDGRLAATAGEKTTRLWDAVTGKELFCWDNENRNDGFQLAFTPNGQLLASANGDGSIALWQTKTGQPLRRFKGHSQGPVYGVAFSPDGQTLLSGALDKTARLWDWKTGKEIHVLRGHAGWVMAIAFAPDGRTAATACTSEDVFIRLWDVKSGKELRRFEGHEPGLNTAITSIAFSPDGRMLASAGFGDTIHLWEVATGKERCCFHAPDYRIGKVAFAPNDHVLVSVGGDGTALLWDATGRLLEDGPLRQRLTRTEWDACWRELADSDARRAYRAMQTILADADHSVAWLKEHISAVRSADPKQTARLIRELDNDDFAVRKRAEQELAKQGESVLAALEQTLKGKPSLEVRKRISQLLEQMEPERSPQQLRLLRAIEMLELAGNREAQEVLETLAAGAEGARPTEQAKAALQRLTRREKN